MVKVEIWAGPSLLRNIIRPPCRLHEQHEGMIGDGSILKPRLPLVGVLGMFFQHGFTLSIICGSLLKDLVSDGTREHVTGDVPGRRGKGQYRKLEKYQGWD